MTAQTILPANSAASGGYEVDNSLRFNSASNDFLNRTQTGGNRKKFTFSTWVKRCNPATRMALFLANRSNSNYNQFFFHEDGFIEADFYHSGTQIFRYKTNALYRDPSAWYHVILAVDTEHDTASSRVRIYVNGLEVTSFATETNPSENVDTHVNENSIVAYIGSDYNSNEPDYYLAETVMLDGTQATPTDFGEFDEDSGIWKPIDVSGLTFGTNGFYLDFEESGTSANSSGLGADKSGNDHHFTVNNLTAVDQSTDTCTNNFATLNPLDVGDKDGRTLSNGNLDFTTSSGNNGHISGTLAVSGSGKWYFETKILAQSGTASSSAKFGIIGIRNINESSADVAGNSYYVYSDGRKEDGDNTTNSAHPGYVLNDIVQVALDLDNGNVYFGLNGDWGDNDGNFDEAFGNATAFFGSINTNGFWTAYLLKNVTADNVLTLSANFGSPSFAISSGNADGDGHGNFEFAVPSGYFALCTKNLAEYG